LTRGACGSARAGFVLGVSIAAASTLSFATTMLACGRQAPLGPVGMSTARTVPPAEGGADAGAEAPAASGIPADFRTTLTKLHEGHIFSKGHAGGRFVVDIYANELGRDAFRRERGEAAPGAMLVKEHFETVEGEEVKGPLMMMEKRDAGYAEASGDWRFVVVDTKGELVADGPVEQCAGCHRDAPNDFVFRIAE
jgi:hypothetical protein